MFDIECINTIGVTEVKPPVTELGGGREGGGRGGGVVRDMRGRCFTSPAQKKYAIYPARGALGRCSGSTQKAQKEGEIANFPLRGSITSNIHCLYLIMPRRQKFGGVFAPQEKIYWGKSEGRRKNGRKNFILEKVKNTAGRTWCLPVL